MIMPRKLRSNLVQLGGIREASLSPDQQFLISLGEDDGMLTVSSVANLEPAIDYNLSGISNFRVRSMASVSVRNFLIFADEGHSIVRLSWPNVSTSDRICECEIDPIVIAVDGSGRLLAVTGAGDPQILIYDLDNPSAAPITNYDNTATVHWLGFGPKCSTLVSANEAGVLTAFFPPDYSESKEIEIGSHKSAIVWTSDTELIVADKGQRGVLKIFDFHREMETITIKIDAHRAPIAALAFSSADLLASADTSQRIVISRVRLTSEPMILTHFDPACEPICVLLWLDGKLCAGSADGYFHMWDQFDPTGKPIPKSESESESESNAVIPHVPLRGRYHPLIPVGRKSDYEIPVQIGSSELDEEEEEEEEEMRGRKRGFRVDEAEEASEESDTARIAPKQDVKKLTSEEMFQRLKSKYASEGESTTETDSSESSGDTEEHEKFEHHLDKKFLVGSDISSETSEEMDDAEAIGVVSDVTASESEDGRVLYQFTPGETSEFHHHRRFLCWNLIGCIFLRENPAPFNEADDPTTAIDIEFADTTKYRNWSFDNGAHRVILGSLSSTGVVLASRTNLQHHSHERWAPDAEFSYRFPESETIDLVASGKGWFCVATERRLLRIFTASGLDVAVFSIPSRATTMVGDGNFLAVVFSDDSFNSFQMFDVKARRMVASGGVPVRNPIKWIGFDNGILFAVGGDLQLISFIHQFGGQWVPVCNIKAHFPANAIDFFCVGVCDNGLWGVFLDEAQPTPLTVSHQYLKELRWNPQVIDANYTAYLQVKVQSLGYAKGTKQKAARQASDKELAALFSKALRDSKTKLASQIAERIQSRKAREMVVQFARAQRADTLADWLEQRYHPEEEKEEQNNTVVEKVEKLKVSSIDQETPKNVVPRDGNPVPEPESSVETSDEDDDSLG
jgi:hypothetical protein